MATPTRISQLQSGAPLQPTDTIPFARGTGLNAKTLSIEAGNIISDLLIAKNSSSVNLIFDGSTRSLSAEVVEIPVTKGGTGKNAHTFGNILIGNGIEALSSTECLQAPKGGTGHKTHPYMQILMGNNEAPLIHLPILPVTNGGTGLASHIEDDILIGNGISPLSSTKILPTHKGGTGLASHPAEEILIGNGSQKIKSVAILPVAKGGTGSLDASGARTNLDAQQTVIGAASTVTRTDLDINRVTISNSSGKLASSTVTTTELDYLKGVRSSIQSQFDALEPAITILPVTRGGTGRSSLPLGEILLGNESGSFTSTAILPITKGGTGAGNATLARTNLDAQQTVTGAASTVTSLDLDSRRVVVSNNSGKLAASTVTTTELGYVGGVTSSIQTQIDSKEPNITILPIAKGGTGNNNFTNGHIVIGNGANALSTVGILPVNRGGTGADYFNNGEILIGNSSGGLTRTTLTAGSNITIQNNSGSITITNAAPHIGTNLSFSQTTDSVSLNSSTGSGTTIPAATYELAGVMSETDKDNLDTIFSNYVNEIQAGDGILVNGQKEFTSSGQVTIEAVPPIYHVRAQNMFGRLDVLNQPPRRITGYPLEDGTYIDFWRFPYNQADPMMVSFDMTSQSDNIPQLTLYYMASAENPLTVFALNSAIRVGKAIVGASSSFNATKNQIGGILPNKGVWATEFEPDANLGGPNVMYIGGNFTALGTHYIGTTRKPRYVNRFAAIDLSAGPNVGDRGNVGEKFTIPGQRPAPNQSTPGGYKKASYFLNQSIYRFPQGTNYFPGFNATVGIIKRFNVTINGAVHQLLLTGGAYTNTAFFPTPPDLSSSTSCGPCNNGNRFTVFDLTTGEVYPFNFNGIVRDITMDSSQRIYVCGLFTAGGIWNDPSKPGRITDPTLKYTKDGTQLTPMKGVARFTIGGTNTSNGYGEILSFANDTSFINQTFNDILVGGGAKHPILTMAIHQDTLYLGGVHLCRIGSGKANSHQYMTAHNLSTGAVITTWRPIFNALVRKILIDPGVGGTDYMYVGGKFTAYDVYPIVKGAAKRRTRILAFNINNRQSPSLILNWEPQVNGIVANMALHESNSSTSPLYIGGSFSKINKSPCSHVAALSKATVIADDAYLPGWNPAANQYIMDSTPGLICVPSGPHKGIFVNGNFLAIGGQIRYYLAKINRRGEGPPQDPKFVEWGFGGTVIGDGGNIEIDAEQVTTVQAEVGTPDSLKSVTFALDPQQFAGIQKGDYCRFNIKRNCTNDTYFKDVWLIGAAVDQSTPKSVLEEPTEE